MLSHITKSDATPYYGGLLFGIVVFIGFGLFHLTLFETVDEHFWKYERIPQYFAGWHKGITTGDWHDTRINDKPGVTVALTAGIGHLLNPVALTHRNREAEEKESAIIDGKKKKFYKIYNTEQTTQLNETLRLPILLFNGFIILPLLFFILYRITKKYSLTTIAFFFIALNPVLIGISQIINPDALLWGLSALALFFFVYTIESNQLRYAFPTGIFMGLALLSKYTATLLFVFFSIYIIIAILLKKQDRTHYRMFFLHYLKTLGITTATAFALFAILMPDVLIVQKHFLYGTIYSPVFKPFVRFLISHLQLLSTLFGNAKNAHVLQSAIAGTLFFGMLTVLFPLAITFVLKRFTTYIRYFLNALIFIMALIFITSIVNAWTGASFMPLDDLKENVRVDGVLAFPMFHDAPPLLFWWKALLVQAQNVVFSLHPLVLIGVGILWWKILRNTLTDKRLLPLFYLFSLLPLIFFLGGLLTNVFVNIRYAIMLYVPYAFLATYGFFALYTTSTLKNFLPRTILLRHLLIYGSVIIAQCLSLWYIKPYYFNYHSFFLPRQYVVTDSWGYGVYEAADYINHLPHPENLIVWSDRNSICQFLKAHCVTSTTLYFDYTPPDYLVLSRRGMIRKHVHLSTTQKHPWFDPAPYYNDKTFLQKQTVKEIIIGHRPKNVVRVVKVLKPQQ